MDINLPNRLHQLICLLGILLTTFSFYKLNHYSDEYFKAENKFERILDSLELHYTEIKILQEAHRDNHENYRNLLKLKDSTLDYGNEDSLVFHRRVESLYRDLNLEFQKILDFSRKIDIEQAWMYKEKSMINRKLDYISKKELVFLILLIIGLFASSLGIFLWYKHEVQKKN